MRWLLVLCFAVASSEGLKILGIFPFPSYSHYSLGNILMRELASRNHQVTFLSPYEEKDAHQNMKIVQLTGFPEKMKEAMKTINLFETNEQSVITSSFFIHGFGEMITSDTLEHPNTKRLLTSGEKFDVIIVEKFVNDALHGFCHHFNAPCIMFSSIGSSYWTNLLVGNPNNPSYMPGMMLNHAGPMNFWQRVKNTALSVYTDLFMYLKVIPSHDRLLQKHFPGAPPLRDLMHNTPLVLLNSHPSIAAPLPHVPNMIEVGGFHVGKPKKLPEDIQTYLDAAKGGVVYFSMGSNLNSKNFPLEKRNGIMKALGKLKMKVLWKFEDDSLPDKPYNVMIRKWLPQQDILAHPNVKLFISHGGMLSTIEAIYHGVPVVGIPVYGDQAMNMKTAVQNGFAVMVPYSSLGEKSLNGALNEILSNPKYAENAKLRSEIMHDQPMKPMDTAIFWIEYIARHRDAKHLRSASMTLSWYQVLLLDVIAFYALIFLVLPLITLKVFKCFCRKPKPSKSNKKKSN